VVSQERTLRDVALGLSVLGMFFGVMPSFNPQPVFFVPFLNRQFGIVVEAVVDRALALNPSFATGWRMSGWLRLWAGNLDVAIEHFETAFRLSPRERNSRLGIGEAQFLQRRFDEAIVTLLTVLEELPGHAGIYRYLASCYAHAGRLDEAREMIRRLRSIAPTVMPHAMYGLQWRNPEHREFYLSGLRLAMGEKT
jgi:adenylate cyclase